VKKRVMLKSVGVIAVMRSEEESNAEECRRNCSDEK
jgi:hypothetical protein